MLRDITITYPELPFNNECTVTLECKNLSEIPEDVYIKRSYEVSVDFHGQIYFHWGVETVKCTKEEKIENLYHLFQADCKAIKRLSIELLYDNTTSREQMEEKLQAVKERALLKMAQLDMIEKYW